MTSSRCACTESLLVAGEDLARRHGEAVPCIQHWLAVATVRSLLVKTVAPSIDPAGLHAEAVVHVSRNAAGERVSSQELLRFARDIAIRRHATTYHRFHLVMAILLRAGLLPAEPAPAIEIPGAPNHGEAPWPITRPAPKPTTPSATKPTVRRPVTKPVATPLLDQCPDLTAEANRGEIDDAVERDGEIRLVMEVLCRPTKANVALVGPAGVGKTKIAEGLAVRIASGRAPEALRGRRVVVAETAWLVQDSKYYGELEKKLIAVLREARAIRAILFIDELHGIVGAGGRDGTDLANLLKPALSRGEVSVIGATTDEEYRRYIEPQTALARRFVVVRVQEPGRTATANILRSVASRIRSRQHVDVLDEAIDAAVRIAARRLPHRREPDRSIDLLETAVGAAIAAGRAVVDEAELQAASARLDGSPAVTVERLRDMAAELADGVLSEVDAEALAERLALAYQGLVVHPERPRAVVLVSGGNSSSCGDRLGPTIARHVFGDATAAVSIDIGSMSVPTAFSSLLGTPQGFVGYSDVLPIHALAQRPHSVVRFQRLDAAHPGVGAVIGKGLTDGFLVDAAGQRIYLSSAVVLLETGESSGPRPGLGFVERPLDIRGNASPAPVDTKPLGPELAGAVDLVVHATRRVTPRHDVRRALASLAARYGEQGMLLTWDASVEDVLLGEATRDRRDDIERWVEVAIGRLVRDRLAIRRRPLPLAISVEEGHLRCRTTRAARARARSGPPGAVAHVR